MESTSQLASPATIDTRREMADFARALGIVRIVGMFLIVAGHASLAFSNSRVPSVLWLIYEYDGSSIVDFIGVFALNVGLPLFFLVGGVSAGYGHAGRSAKEFLKKRARGILLPFTLAAVTILPLAFGIWSYGMQVGQRHDMSLAQRTLLEEQFADANLLAWGPMHLWFLEYLFLMSVGYCVVRLIARRWSTTGTESSESSESAPNASERFFSSPWYPVWFALPTVAMLLIDLTSWSHLLPRSIPSVTRLLYFATYFAAGVMVSRLQQPCRVLQKRAWLYFLASWPIYVVAFVLAIRHFSEKLNSHGCQLLAVFVALSVWLHLFGLLGLAARRKHRLPAMVTYLLEASFWVYLVHVPIVALVQVELSRYRIPSLVKLGLTVAFTLAVTLLVYEAVVRYSALGKLINGRAKRKSSKFFARLPRRRFAWACAGMLLLALGTHYGWLAFSNNLHVVAEGSIVRSSQLAPEDLEQTIQRHGIRTVLSVRGGRPERGWYRKQMELCARLGVEAHALRIPAHQAPTRGELSELIELLTACPRPILIHGKSGYVRPGLAAAVALLLDGQPTSVAKQQFSFKYGYAYAWADKGPHRVVDQYELWLAERRSDKSSANSLTEFVRQSYGPGFYRAKIVAAADPVHARTGEPVSLQFDVTNTSCWPWRERSDAGRGVRLAVVVQPITSSQPAFTAFSRPREGRIAAGEHRTFDVTLPAFASAGRYRARVDLIDEQTTWFSDRGTGAMWLDVEVDDSSPARLARNRSREQDGTQRSR